MVACSPETRCFGPETRQGEVLGNSFCIVLGRREWVDTLRICANLQSVRTLLTSRDHCTLRRGSRLFAPRPRISKARCAYRLAAAPTLRSLRHNPGSPNTMQTIKRFLSNEEGLETVEYGLVAALIVIVAIVAMQTIGPKLAAIYTQISNALG